MSDTKAVVRAPELALLGLVDPVELARGGFGVVYRARQPELHREVALKVMSAPVHEPRVRSRFERECRAMGMLSDHPGIVTIFDAGFTSDERPYLVMELMDHGSLARRVQARGRLQWVEVLATGVKVAAALEMAHRAGILHRDVKPENILLSGYGEPKLSDFGIARFQGAVDTRSGELAISISHAAPELLDGGAATVRSDLYSLGSTLYTLLTGAPPYGRTGEASVVQVMQRIVQEPLPDLRPHDVPDALCAVIERLTAKDASARYRTAQEAAVALRAAQTACGVAQTDLVLPELPASVVHLDLEHDDTLQVDAPAPAREPVPPRRVPRLAAAVTVALLVVAGAAAALLRPHADVQSEVARAVAAGSTTVDVTEMQRQVAELRGLPAGGPLEVRVLDAAAYDAAVRSWAVAGREQSLPTEELVLRGLGLLGADIDLAATTQDLYAEQFLTFYDDAAGEVVVRADAAGTSPMQRALLADDVTEALLRRHYGISRDQVGDPDAARAMDALLKGDVLTTSAAWVQRHLSQEEQARRLADQAVLPDSVARSVPAALRAELVFPFVAGESFFAAVAARNRGADAAYRDLPDTTEQILDPSAYATAEPAVRVRVEATLPAPWRPLTRRTFGAFDVQQLLAALGTPRAAQVAEGWGGGELRAWASSDDIAVAVWLELDTAADARQACRALRDLYEESAESAAATRVACEGLSVRLGAAGDVAIARSLVGERP